MSQHSTPTDELDESELQIGLVIPQTVRMLWPKIYEVMKAHPLRNGVPLFATPEQIMHLAENGRYAIWVAGEKGAGSFEMVWVCSILNYPSAKAMQVLYLGGRRMREVFQHLEQFELWVASCGCTHIETNTAPGMSRLLEKYGFTTPACYTYKSLVAFAS